MTHPLPNGTRVRVSPPHAGRSPDAWTGRTLRVVGWIPDGDYKLSPIGTPLADDVIVLGASRIEPEHAP